MGFLQAFAVLAVLTAIHVFAWGRSFGYPSAALLRTISEIGVALLLANIVEAVWLVSQARREDFHHVWLGFISGIALGGFLGVVAALATAAHLEAGHRNLLDDIGLWWSVISLCILGVLVTVQPLFADQTHKGSAGHGDAH